MKLVYATHAVEDLARLREFIARHEPDAAARVARELLTRVEALTEFPRLGMPVAFAPDPETIRDMVFGRYVVRYAVHSSTITILRVWHEREGTR